MHFAVSCSGRFSIDLIPTMSNFLTRSRPDVATTARSAISRLRGRSKNCALSSLPTFTRTTYSVISRSAPSSVSLVRIFTFNEFDTPSENNRSRTSSARPFENVEYDTLNRPPVAPIVPSVSNRPRTKAQRCSTALYRYFFGIRRSDDLQSINSCASASSTSRSCTFFCLPGPTSSLSFNGNAQL